MAKSKKPAGAATSTVEEAGPPPPPGDHNVDLDQIVAGDKPAKKSLGQLAADDLGSSAGGLTLMALTGADDSVNTMINDAVALKQESDENVRNLLDLSTDDITRAKSVEALNCYDASRAAVLADIEVSNCVARGDIPRALDTLEKKNRIRGGVFDAMAKRKRLEMDDVTSHRRHIIQQTINQVVEDLEKALSEEGIEGPKSVDILQRLADKISVRHGEDSDG